MPGFVHAASGVGLMLDLVFRAARGMPRWGARCVALASLLVVLLTADGGAARAHRALLIGTEGQSRPTAMWLTDADIAWAVHGTLTSGATQHLAFTRPASGMFRARVLVGTRQANLSLNPWLALVGPGLERPPGLEGLLHEGEGAVLIGPPPDREVELFQDVPWPVLVGASMELALPAEGVYYLLILDLSGQAGPYIVDTGYLQD
jgi:hypothetical protein